MLPAGDRRVAELRSNRSPATRLHSSAILGSVADVKSVLAAWTRAQHTRNYVIAEAAFPRIVFKSRHRE